MNVCETVSHVKSVCGTGAATGTVLEAGETLAETLQTRQGEAVGAHWTPTHLMNRTEFVIETETETETGIVSEVIAKEAASTVAAVVEMWDLSVRNGRGCACRARVPLPSLPSLPCSVYHCFPGGVRTAPAVAPVLPSARIDPADIEDGRTYSALALRYNADTGLL
jgi:hypothetical protein